MAADEPRPCSKRKDAAQNNERLIQAAREVFARQGLSATLVDIARHAGIGVGTVYRNFASKRQIVFAGEARGRLMAVTGRNTLPGSSQVLGRRLSK